MKVQNFPLLSSHLMPESSAMVSYKAIFNRLLIVLRMTKNVDLLYLIASVSSGDPNHVCKDEIQDTLKFFTKR